MLEQEPRYYNVEHIIEDLWCQCLELEIEYYNTGDKEVLLRFSICVGLIQYWEETLYAIGGYQYFRFYF